jgi:hypothetical protein
MIDSQISPFGDSQLSFQSCVDLQSYEVIAGLEKT